MTSQPDVPLFDLPYGPEEEEAVRRVLESKWLTLGPVTEEFEAAFAAYVGSKHAVAVCNGTAALHLALAVVGTGPEDEVIVPSLTFVATANAVLYCGAAPVFADITGEHDLTILPGEIERKITDRTKAILVMHYGGYACDMARIMETAERHKLFVMEDAAHAPGAVCAMPQASCPTEARGPWSVVHGPRRCGSLGNLGCFSFFSNKNLATGEGGMV
ncbi:MAG: aminotransferase class I/II-fold pyridoxal phosphate-dependent enzyme, partial [Armatimonadetes bacterium]|nr:aminotransferase class I/II-fold pyridoxal phosphate-dependent enzyme [Armatimonadota bacterium]